jgi:hypothetical protein
MAEMRERRRFSVAFKHRFVGDLDDEELTLAVR